MPLKDPKQRLVFNRDYYLRNRERLLVAESNRREARKLLSVRDRNKHERTRREQRQLVIRLLKELACADCGVNYPPYVKDFDHVRGEKLFSIGRAGNGGSVSLEAIVAEAAKCDVVCANCHRERTYGKKGAA